METISTTYAGAIRRTLKEEMMEDESIFLLGEDIADPYGGIHNATRGLTNQFGEKRVINSPLSEVAIAGAGVGAAVNGMRPVIEMMYADFLPIAMDQIVNGAAKMNFLSHGEYKCPLVIRANFGSGTSEGAQHSQNPEAWLMNFPGLKIVSPSTPRDVQGLLKSSIQDDNPVLFFEHKLLYKMKGDILKENVAIPLGKAEIKRFGSEITVVASSLMVLYSLEAAEQLAQEGINVEVIDIRTLKPYDAETICESVRKTGRLLSVEEGAYTGGWGAQIVQDITAREFSSFKCAPQRLAGLDMPLPARPDLEAQSVPSVESIKVRIRKMIKE